MTIFKFTIYKPLPIKLMSLLDNYYLYQVKSINKYKNRNKTQSWRVFEDFMPYFCGGRSSMKKYETTDSSVNNKRNTICK